MKLYTCNTQSIDVQVMNMLKSSEVYNFLRYAMTAIQYLINLYLPNLVVVWWQMPRVTWDAHQVGFLHAVFYIGFILTQIPAACTANVIPCNR